MEKVINLPLKKEDIENLKAGDSVLLNGYIYTARDAAHKKLMEVLEKKKELPINIKEEIIYYVGPTPEQPGEVIGSAGPTTSYRMDDYTPKLIERGLSAVIGKGMIGDKVVESMIKNRAVYLGAIGGIGALISKTIKEAEIIAYEELGAEAIRRIRVENFPAFVVIDVNGNNLYKMGRDRYLNK